MKDLIQENVSLKSFNTLRLESKARYYSEPKKLEDIIYLQKFAQDKNIKLYILGNGSNIIVRDSLDALVISTKELDNYEVKANEIILEAGTKLLKVIGLSIEHNLSGFEPFWGIPATIGGALTLNAGSRFGCISDIVNWVEVINHDSKLQKLQKNEIHFGYRNSSLNNLFIYRCSLILKKSDYNTIINNLKEVVLYKTQNQPLASYSAGCIFKNPVKDGRQISAGKLIEEAGLKSVKVGEAQVSPKHANFIINNEKATFNNIIELINLVKGRVKEKFGIELELEVKIWD